MKTRRAPPVDVLADARRVIAANDRELALQLLLKICSGGERTASLAQDGHESPRRLFRRGTWSLSRRWSSRDGLYRGDRGPVFYGPAGIRAAVR